MPPARAVIPTTPHTNHPNTTPGADMPKTTPEQNKAIVLEAFDTLFNKSDYAAAERFWSPKYIQHSAHIDRDAKDYSLLSARRQIRCATKTNSSSRKAIMSSHMAASQEWESLRPGSLPT